MKSLRSFYPLIFFVLEFVVLLILPSEYYVGASCLQTHPYPICGFHFSPSLAFFLAVTLPFMLAVAVSLWKKLNEEVVIFASSYVTTLISVALLHILNMSPLALFVPIAPAFLPGEKGKELGRMASVISLLSLIAVYFAVKMATGQKI